MTVSVSFRTNQSVSTAPIATPNDHGTISPGGTSTQTNYYVSHDGDNPITNCRLYILPYSGAVSLSTRTPQDDYEDLLAWGDGGDGLLLNMDYQNSWAEADQSFTSSSGASLATAITLIEESIIGTPSGDGIIPADDQAVIRLQVSVPGTVTDTGIYYVDVVLAYDSTS